MLGQNLPELLRVPRRLRSPAVASTDPCDDADDEEKRQRLASRCTIQIVNVALLLCSALLRQMLVQAEPRAGEGVNDTAVQKLNRHTGVVFTRAHARYFFEVVAAALRIPGDVLVKVLGIQNPPGNTDDGKGLLLVEKLLHGGPSSVPLDEQNSFFEVTSAMNPVYGHMISPMADEGPIKWKLTRRGDPTASYPAVLEVGTVDGGRVPTLGGYFAGGYMVDMSRISVHFVSAAMVSLADGSARRGGDGWADLPPSVDYPAALLASERSGPPPSIEVMASDLVNKTMEFFTMYRARTEGGSQDAPVTLAIGDPRKELSVAEAATHMAAGKQSVANRLLPPSMVNIIPLHDIYGKLRRRDRLVHRAPSEKVDDDMLHAEADGARDETGDDLALAGITSRGTVTLDPAARSLLKRRCTADALPQPKSRVQRVVEKLGLVPMLPTRVSLQNIIESVAEDAINATLAGAIAPGQLDVQQLVKSLQEQLCEVTSQRDVHKKKKQELSKLLAHCRQDLMQTQEDLLTARANAQVDAPMMGPTDSIIFQVQLATERRAFKDLQHENEELVRSHTNARLTKESLEYQLMSLQTTNRLERASQNAKLATMQDQIEAQDEKLYRTHCSAAHSFPSAALAYLADHTDGLSVLFPPAGNTSLCTRSRRVYMTECLNRRRRMLARPLLPVQCRPPCLTRSKRIKLITKNCPPRNAIAQRSSRKSTWSS